MAQRTRFLLLTAWVLTAVLQVPRAEAQLAPGSLSLPARFSYAAKFVCGFSSSTTTTPPKEPAVKKGNYATIINIHNPWSVDVQLLKKVALAAPERFPNTVPVPPTKRFPDRLQSDHALSVDCTEIVNLLTLNGTPPPATVTFIEGFVVIDAFFPPGATSNTAADVDVVTVTSTAASATGTVLDHEVTTVPGRSLPAGTWPF